MKIVAYILTDSVGDPEIFSSEKEVKDVLIDIINYEYEKSPSVKEIELKEANHFFSLLEKNKIECFSFFIDERELCVYKKELTIPCGY